MDTHIVSTSFAGGMAFDADIDTHIVRMDVGEADGGLHSGPSPKKMMLASLAGCTGVDIVSILNKMRIPFTDLRIDTEGWLSETQPRIYQRIKINYYIRIAEASRPKMGRAVQLSADTSCGVMAMFRAFAKIETAIIYL
jgi:putative redox protein